METKTETKTPLTELAERLANAPTGQNDKWLDYYREWNENVHPFLPQSTDPKEIVANESLYRVHFGLFLYDQGSHPLYAQLSEPEREAMDVIRRGMTRIFKNQKEAGLYDKFFSRVSAAR